MELEKESPAVQLQKSQQRESHYEELLLLKELEYKELYRELFTLKDQIQEAIKAEHESETYASDEALREEQEQLVRLIEEKRSKIEKMKEEQMDIQFEEDKIIQMREKYKTYAIDNELLRNYREGEYFRSMVDTPNAYRLVYENVHQELQRKLQLKTRLEGEKKQYLENITNIRKLSKEAKAREHKLIEELEMKAKK